MAAAPATTGAAMEVPPISTTSQVPTPGVLGGKKGAAGETRQSPWVEELLMEFQGEGPKTVLYHSLRNG